jgi:L-threonylcarbamoyladenylate synthase
MENDKNILLEEVNQSLHVLRKGGLILYPTDTIWGIGCDATNSKAIEEIYALKQRAESKSLIILVLDAQMLKKYVRHVPSTAADLMERYQRPLTIIYPEAENLPKNLVPSSKTVAIRIPNHPFCAELLRQFQKPIVSTSANISGKPSPSHYYEIEKDIRDGVGYVVNLDRGNLRNTSPSTIIRIHTNGDFEIIRE